MLTFFARTILNLRHYWCNAPLPRDSPRQFWKVAFPEARSYFNYLPIQSKISKCRHQAFMQVMQKCKVVRDIDTITIDTQAWNANDISYGEHLEFYEYSFGIWNLSLSFSFREVYSDSKAPHLLSYLARVSPLVLLISFTMPFSFTSSTLAISILAFAQTTFATAPVCSASLPFSCQTSVKETDTCCFETPGGQVLQVQFWYVTS